MLKTLKFIKTGFLLCLLCLGFMSCDSNEEDECLNPQTWYEDQDGDMYGNADVSLEDCEQPVGYVLDNTDVNDQDEFNYTISISEPALSEYKVGEQLPILLDFNSRSGEAVIGNVSYTITNVNSGAILKEFSTQTSGDPTTYQIDNSLDLLGEFLTDGESTILKLDVKVESLSNTGELSVTKEITLKDCDNPQTWYEDLDGDMYGNANVSIENCTQPDGFVLDNSDFNDDEDFFNFAIYINEPALSEYKAGEQLPILINYGSLSGTAQIWRVAYSITRKDNGKELVGSDDITPSLNPTFQVENNLFVLTEDILDGDTSVELLLTATVAGVFNSGETILTKDISVVE